jgi:hypothetical protein
VRSCHPGENKESRHFSILNGEAGAINTAISITRNTIKPKRVDSQRFAELPHSPGCDEENLQPQGGENDESNPPIEGAPDSHVGPGTGRPTR